MGSQNVSLASSFQRFTSLKTVASSSIQRLGIYKAEAEFTLHDSLSSLLDHTIIHQCKRGGARASPRVFLSCASFLTTSTARAVSDYWLRQPIGILFYSVLMHRRELFSFFDSFHSINLVQNQKSICSTNFIISLTHRVVSKYSDRE